MPRRRVSFSIRVPRSGRFRDTAVHSNVFNTLLPRQIARLILRLFYSADRAPLDYFQSRVGIDVVVNVIEVFVLVATSLTTIL